MKSNKENSDYYRMKIGIRTLRWTSKELLLNDEPIYLRGFGKHEDSMVSDKYFLNIIFILYRNIILNFCERINMLI